MLTIGGFSYMTSAGNQAQVGTSKKLITDAILGLIVVFVSWLVLYTINPDLLGAEPSKKGLTIDYATIALKDQGKVIQKDIHCKKGTTVNCENSLQDCEKKYGSGNCGSIANTIKDTDFLGEGEDGSITKYDNEAECYASGELNCISGRSYKKKMAYGKEEADSRSKLETDKIDVKFNARTEHLTEKTIANLKDFANDAGQIEIQAVSREGTVIDLGRSNTHIVEYAKDNDAKFGFEIGASWGKLGDTKYYKITKGENKGIVVAQNSKTGETFLFMQKKDGSDYTLQELGLKCNDTLFSCE
jgi:hypothetical protein